MTATRAVRGGRRIRVTFLLSHPDATVVATLVVCGVLFGVFASGFASVDNVRSIVISAAVIACIALGENLVILAGEIDVSVGSILALAGFAAGPVAVATDNLWLTLAVGSVLGIPASTLVVLAAFAVITLWRRNTNAGRDLIAVGANRRAAQTMGVRVRRELIVAFTLAGTLAGLAAVMYLGEVGGMETSVIGTNTVLQVIAACAIGGTSIQGGRGTDLAPLTGALLIGVITSGVVVLGVAGVWFQFVYGALILLAVARDRLWQSRKVS